MGPAIQFSKGEVSVKTAELFSLADARAEANSDAPSVKPDEPSRIDWSGARERSGLPDEKRGALTIAGKPLRWPTLLLCLNVACLSVTLLTGAILFFVFQPIQTLGAMNETLLTIESAEKRLRADIVGAASRLDGIIQIRMDRADTAQYELLEGLGALRASVEDTADTVRDGGAEVDDRLSAMLVTIADLTAPAPSAPAQAMAPTRRKSGPKKVAAVSSGAPAPTSDAWSGLKGASPKFKRQEMPDGSVAYRRID